MLQFQKTFWNQRAKVIHVSLMDTNSGYFHKVANGRRNIKYIKEIRTNAGAVISGDKNIRNEVRNDFSLRFNKEHIDTNTLSSYLPLISAEISREENEQLTRV